MTRGMEGKCSAPASCFEPMRLKLHPMIPAPMPPSDAALLALGFSDAARARRLWEGCARTDEERAALGALGAALWEELGGSAEPMGALLFLSNLCDRLETGAKVEFFGRLAGDAGACERLARLLGQSRALADCLARDGAALEMVFAPALPVSRAQLRRLAGECADLDELRLFRRRQFVRIGLLDYARATWRDEAALALVVRQVSDLAQVVVEHALALLAPSGTEGFCVVMLGKGGARELNYSSDIDLVLLHENRDDAILIGTQLLRALSDITAAGFLWRADVRLRPDGSAGALVTPFGYALSYYESFAGAWEWQALIKARVVAGDARLGRRFRRFTRAVVWAKRADDGHLREVWDMKRQSERTPSGRDARDVKSGPGGIRDAEWVVQQLQMMLGPSFGRARRPDTLGALRALEELGALASEEARELRAGYEWMRVVEHRLQLWAEQAQRQLPASPVERAVLARRMGCAWRGDAATRWFDEEHARHQGQIRARCEALFWAFRAEFPDGDLADLLPPSLASKGAARLERLAGGTATRPIPLPLGRQIRAVLPGALRSIERAADPERALAAFENLCEASGNRLSLLRSLDAAPRLGEAIWTILGGAQGLADTLVHAPQLLDFVANRALLESPRLGPQARAACRDYCLAFRDRNAALRRWRARELLRIGLRDLLMDAPSAQITAEIAHLAGACLDLAVEEIRAKLRPASNALAFTVIGVGKFGGVEMHYASDLDVVFVGESWAPEAHASGLSTRFAEELIAFVGEPSAEGAGWSLDARLRPGGASGALAVTTERLRDYFDDPRQGFAVWERQSLTRARLGAGDFGLGARAMASIRAAAHPNQWNPAWGDELRHIKTRVERERAAKPSGGVPVFDVKLGSGALGDIEWAAQWLALRHGAAFPALQTPNTRAQLGAARDGGYLSDAEHATLLAAYDWLRRAELRWQIARDGARSGVRRDSPDFRIWARAVFPNASGDDASALFEQTWDAHTRSTRAIFERIRAAL